MNRTELQAVLRRIAALEVWAQEVQERAAAWENRRDEQMINIRDRLEAIEAELKRRRGGRPKKDAA